MAKLLLSHLMGDPYSLEFYPRAHSNRVSIASAASGSLAFAIDTLSCWKVQLRISEGVDLALLIRMYSP